MALDAVLKKLESRIDELVESHRKATSRVAELEKKLEKLEAERAEEGDLKARVASLESQREELVGRLERVLGTIDEVLTSSARGSS
jgi:chromosome segregation ATPase